jgi:hypothetical protein
LLLKEYKEIKTQVGETVSYLGMRVTNTPDAITLDQEEFARALIQEKASLIPARQPAVPVTETYVLHRDEDEELDAGLASEYVSVVASLNHMATTTRPDLAPAVSMLSAHMSKPYLVDYVALCGVMGYLARTIDVKLIYRKGWQSDSCRVSLLSDSSFAPTGEHSRVGILVYVGQALVGWSSVKGKRVAMCSEDAELQAATEGCKMALFVQGLVKFVVGDAVMGPIYHGVDSSGALRLAEESSNVGVQGSGIAKRYRVLTRAFVHELVQKGELRMVWIPTDMMLADCMTKSMPPVKFRPMWTGMFDPGNSSVFEEVKRRFGPVVPRGRVGGSVLESESCGCGSHWCQE